LPRCRQAATGGGFLSGQAAKVRAPVATIIYQEGDERARTTGIYIVGDSAAFTRAVNETGADEDSDMGRERIVRAADGFGELARG
jgi:hypothetical protein